MPKTIPGSCCNLLSVPGIRVGVDVWKDRMEGTNSYHPVAQGLRRFLVHTLAYQSNQGRKLTIRFSPAARCRNPKHRLPSHLHVQRGVREAPPTTRSLSAFACDVDGVHGCAGIHKLSLQAAGHERDG